MDDLFTPKLGNQETRLELEGADVLFEPRFMDREDAAELFSTVHATTDWKAVEISIWGKRVLQPRLICWCGDSGASYKYSGVRLEPQPWTDALLGVRNSIERLSGATFNSVLLNLYRDQNDHMGWHSDDEPDLGEQPVIASLSLGETREFLMRHKARKDLKVKLPLTSGSLLVMRGATQRNWEHAIRKETARLGQRINLTFRRVLI
jgi:alkylated DNA repair dioxygenase AlkB